MLDERRTGTTTFGLAIILSTIMVVETTAFNLRIFINHDIAWILYSVRRLLAGATFGIEVFAVNPPLIWWISTPVVALADWTGSGTAGVFVLATTVVSTLSVLGVALLLRGRMSVLKSAPTGPTLLIVGAFVLFPASFRDFGQREYLALVLGAPYLMLSSLRLGSEKVGRAPAIVVGLFAGIGFCLKPYFIAVPLLTEALLLLRGRSSKTLLRPEVLAMGCVGVSYVALIWIFAPAWILRVIPVANLTFGAFERPLGVLIGNILPTIVGFFIAIFFRFRDESGDLDDVLIAAILGFAASYFVQMKGYTYHAFPLRALTLVLLTLQASRIIARIVRQPAAGKRLLAQRAALFVGVSTLLWFDIATVVEWRRYAAPGRPYYERTIALVRLCDRFNSFLALSTHPYPGFPTALYTEAEWMSRTNSKWLLPSVAAARGGAGSLKAEQQREAEAKAWEELASELERRPELVLVDSASTHHGMHNLTFDVLAFYQENEQIRALWRRYEEIEAVSGYRVFILKP